MATILFERPLRSTMSYTPLFDRLAQEMLMPQMRNGGTFRPAFNVIEDAEGYSIEAALPGLKPEDLQVSFENHVLTVHGEITSEPLKAGASYHLREHSSGSFERSFTFPVSIDAEHTTANYENGILKLRLPRAEETKPRRIPVQVVPEMLEPKRN